MQGRASRMEVVLRAETHGVRGCHFLCVLLLLQLAWEPQCVTSSGQPCVLFGVLLKGVGLFCCGALLLVCCFGFFI